MTIYNLEKKEFILSCGYKGLRVHCVEKTWPKVDTRKRKLKDHILERINCVMQDFKPLKAFHNDVASIKGTQSKPSRTTVISKDQVFKYLAYGVHSH